MAYSRYTSRHSTGVIEGDRDTDSINSDPFDLPVERLATQLGLAMDDTAAEWGCLLTQESMAAGHAIVAIDRSPANPPVPPPSSASPDALLLAAFERSQPVFANRVSCSVLAGFPSNCPPIQAFALFPCRFANGIPALLVLVNPAESFASPVINRVHERLKLSIAAQTARFARHIDQSESLSVAFQPVWHLGTGHLYGLEAFARWPDQQDTASTRSCLQGLERDGQLADVADRVIRMACEHWASWEHQDLIEPSVTLALNIASDQLKAPNFIETLANTLDEFTIPTERVVLEIDESVWHDELLEPTFHELKGIGLKLCLDRFGTGQSSLARLARLPLDQLKLSIDFLAELDRQATSGAAGQTVVSSIIELARSLVLPVVAVGVESSLVRETLAAFGCTAGQGYAMAPPLPAREIPALLAQIARSDSEHFGEFVNLSDERPVDLKTSGSGVLLCEPA